MHLYCCIPGVILPHIVSLIGRMSLLQGVSMFSSYSGAVMIAGRVTQNVRRSDSFSFQHLAAAWFAVPSLMMPVNIWSRRVSPLSSLPSAVGSDAEADRPFTASLQKNPPLPSTQCSFRLEPDRKPRFLIGNVPRPYNHYVRGANVLSHQLSP